METPNWNNLHKGRWAWVLTTSWSIGDITPEQWTEIDQDIRIGVNGVSTYHPVDYICFLDYDTYLNFEGVRNNTAQWVFTRPHNRPIEMLNIVYWSPRRHEPSTDFQDGYFAAGSSAHLALNLALVMGCNPIIVAGLDFKKNQHIVPYATDNPDEPYGRADMKFEEDRAVIGWGVFAAYAKITGRTIINAYPDSPLKCFEKKSVAEILNA